MEGTQDPRVHMKIMDAVYSKHPKHRTIEECLRYMAPLSCAHKAAPMIRKNDNIQHLFAFVRTIRLEKPSTIQLIMDGCGPQLFTCM